MSGNYGISEDGLVALAEAIKTNYTLGELNLSYNNINNVGVSALAEAIKTNSTLRELNLSDSGTGYDVLQHWLKQSKQIQR